MFLFLLIRFAYRTGMTFPKKKPVCSKIMNKIHHKF